MKNKKIVITLVVMLVVMLMLVTRTYAANSFSASLTPSSSKVNKGEEVKVTLKLSSINIDGGINGLTATLKYDSDVVTLVEDSIEELNSWTCQYNADNGKMSLDKANAIEDDEELVTFTFKVDDNTTATTFSIKLTSIKGANSSLDDEVAISDINTVISIGNGTITSPSASTSASTSTSSSPSASTSESVSPSASTSSSNGSTTENGTMPDTGKKQSYIFPLFAAIAVLGIVAFVNYKKIDNK